jgi:hypothetical protein
MISALICGYNLFCHIDNIKDYTYNNKYPKDVAELCRYFERQKTELPEYCFYKSETFIPRRRSEF